MSQCQRNAFALKLISNHALKETKTTLFPFECSIVLIIVELFGTLIIESYATYLRAAPSSSSCNHRHATVCWMIVEHFSHRILIRQAHIFDNGNVTVYCNFDCTNTKINKFNYEWKECARSVWEHGTSTVTQKKKQLKNFVVYQKKARELSLFCLFFFQQFRFEA